MRIAAAIVLICLLVLALRIGCALIGRRSCPPPSADPYAHPFGECTVVPFPSGSILHDRIRAGEAIDVEAIRRAQRKSFGAMS